jgi:hypothetical protein
VINARKILVYVRFSPFLFPGINQNNIRITIHTKIIAKIFARNRRKLQFVIDMLRNLIPTPVAHSGGIKAAAIATHARDSDKRLNPSERKAIIHPAKAIKRSTNVGDVLLVISVVIVAKGTKNVITLAVVIATIILKNKTLNPFL